MNYTIISLACLVTFLIGFMIGKRKSKHDSDTAIKAIAKLNAVIQIYEATHKEEIDYLSEKYIDEKEDLRDCIELNKVLKEEIKKFKH